MGQSCAEADAAGTLVRHERNVVAHEPEHGVGGGFTGRAGTDHVTHVSQREALLFQGINGLDGADDAILVGVMPGRAFFSIARACSGMSGRDQASGAGDRSSVLVSPVTLEHGDGDLLGQGRAVQEPLGVGPGLQHLLGVGIARLGLLFHVVEGVEHQQGVGEALAARGARVASSSRSISG